MNKKTLGSFSFLNGNVNRTKKKKNPKFTFTEKNPILIVPRIRNDFSFSTPKISFHFQENCEHDKNSQKLLRLKWKLIIPGVSKNEKVLKNVDKLQTETNKLLKRITKEKATNLSKL